MENTKNNMTGSNSKDSKPMLRNRRVHFLQKKKDLLGSSEVTTRLGCRYASDVSLSVPSASKSITFQEPEIALEKGRHTRKDLDVQIKKVKLWGDFQENIFKGLIQNHFVKTNTIAHHGVDDVDDYDDDADDANFIIKRE